MKRYNFKKIIFSSIIMLIAILLSFDNFTSIVYAASDETLAMNQAPDGVPVGSYFSILNPTRPGIADSNYPYMHNSATIDSGNPDIVVLAKGATRDNATVQDGVYGGAWSDPSKDNYLDISKKQTISVWLYFGSGNGTNSLVNGQGMALVLQNDPRKNSSGQSQALGAGYQGMGVLGYDRSIVNYKYSNLGLTRSYSPVLPESSYVAGTAIQNSVSLDFDAVRNDTVSLSGLANNGPINFYKTTPNYNIWGNATGYFEYTLNGFDTVNTADSFGNNISKSFPGYSDLIANRPLTQNALRLGNNGGNGYGVIAMTYPGNALTYGQSPLNVNSKNDYNYFTNAKSTAAVQVYAKSADLVDASDNTGNPIYWHHVTFTWNPARNADGTPTSDGMPVSGGTPASINYKFNDKLLDGSTNSNNISDYPKVEDTIPVDPTQFNLTNGNTKVYWGLTGSNTTDPGVYSKMAIFESIPALATAQVTSKIIDKSLSNQVITDEDKTTTVPNRTVLNNDILDFNYNLKFDAESSRQNWNNIMSEIELPTANVDFTGSGVITYHTDDGTTETQTIPLDWSTETPNEIKHKLAYSLGTYLDSTNNPKQFTSADIDFTGTANNKTSLPITVDPEPATFTGDNAIETSSSPKFIISNTSGSNQLLQLKVSDNLAFQDINYKATQNLIQRKTPFTLSVTSLKAPWSLQASTKGLFLNGNGTKFNGNLVYKTNSTTTPITLSEVLQPIATDDSEYETATTSDISGNWSNDSGLLLQPTSPDNTAGQYSGTITWSLNNTLN